MTISINKKVKCKLCNAEVTLDDPEIGFSMIKHLKDFHKDAFAEWIFTLKKYYEVEKR